MLSIRRYVSSTIRSPLPLPARHGFGTPINFNTEAMWREMMALVDVGMSHHRVIGAATRINAEIMGMGDELGTIEPGKLADIIVVKGNPLFNLMALADVEVVVKDGKVLKGGN